MENRKYLNDCFLVFYALAPILNCIWHKQTNLKKTKEKQIMKKSLLVIAIAAFSFIQSATAQDGLTANHAVSYTVPKVALVDVEGGSSISLALTAPTEAGLGMVTSATNSALWLNYSSTTATAATNTISVKADVLLPGMALKVLAAADASAGAGTAGTPTSIVTLTTSDQNIVTAIGTCYTGDGTSNGHNLTYSLATTDYSLIKYTATPTVVTVTYTITNN